MTKVITIVDVDDLILEGTVWDAEKRVHDGTEYWVGVCGFRGGSCEISVPAHMCEEWNEQKHDPMAHFRRVMREHELHKNDQPSELEARERAELARLKVKYE